MKEEDKPYKLKLHLELKSLDDVERFVNLIKELEASQNE